MTLVFLPIQANIIGRLISYGLKGHEEYRSEPQRVSEENHIRFRATNQSFCKTCNLRQRLISTVMAWLADPHTTNY